MLTHKDLPVSAVVYAKDMNRLAGFYEKALQLNRAEESEDFVVLAADAIELAIVQVPPYIATEINIAQPPVVREDTPIKLSFSVPSIEALRVQIAEAGGALKPTGASWSWRGAIHLDGWDSEGNVFQLRQSGA